MTVDAIGVPLASSRVTVTGSVKKNLAVVEQPIVVRVHPDHVADLLAVEPKVAGQVVMAVAQQRVVPAVRAAAGRFPARLQARPNRDRRAAHALRGVIAQAGFTP